jgi:predicted flavoprotein YhiN
VTAPLLLRNARRDTSAATTALRAVLPARIAERWMAIYPPADWTNASLSAFEQHLHAWRVTPAGTEGYAKAEVTVGGVDTAELDAKTMQSRKVPGLFFIGEVVDVTGWLGGYNFQWAWASGVAAGLAV